MESKQGSHFRWAVSIGTEDFVNEIPATAQMLKQVPPLAVACAPDFGRNDRTWGSCPIGTLPNFRRAGSGRKVSI